MLQRLDHIGIAVKDLDVAVERIEQVLGLKTNVIAEVEDQQVRAALVPTPIGRFELMEPTSPDGAVGRFLERRGEGAHHVCFAVEDIEKARQHVLSKGGQLVGQEARPGLTGIVDFVHPRSTGGVLVELAKINLFTPGFEDPDLQFHHVTLRTEDADAAAERWKELFGISIKRTLVSEGFQMKTAWLDAGDAEVEFAQQLNETGPVARAIKNMGEGFHALVLESSEPDQLAAHVQELGLRVIRDDSEPTNVLRAIHPLDFMGTLVLLAAKGVIHGR